MDTNNKTYFKKLANQIMFDLNDEEVMTLQQDFDDLLKQIQLLDEIDTTGIREMIFPFEAETTFLRDDVVDEVLSQADALMNAPEVKEGQIVVPKVVG